MINDSVKMQLKEIYKRFPKKENCISFLESLIWFNKPYCPYCNSNNYTSIKNKVRYHCNNCNMSYSVLVNTIFKSTKIDLQKWFVTILILNEFNESISSRKLAKKIDVTKDTAWRMMTIIRRSNIGEENLIKNICTNIIKEVHE